MMLKSLTIQNFRSYGNAPVKIEFDRGILLFEGDIGSGKSSILYAIEFAFFGLGDIEAKYMLRGSAPVAKVELEFEVGNNEYRIIRTIERKKGSGGIQTRGWISENGSTEEEMKPTEMKSKVLQILSFREKPGKSSSRIYRFAVFTPQELMKEVLSQRADERLETLRRAFGIEDYSFAGSNTGTIVSRLNSLVKTYSEVSKPLPVKEELLRKTNESLRKSELDLQEISNELTERSSSISEIESNLSLLEKERDEARQIQAVIPQLEAGLLQIQNEYSEARIQLGRYETNLKEVKQAKITIAKLQPEYDTYLEAKKKLQSLDDLQEKSITIEKKIADLNRSISTKEARYKTEISLIAERLVKLESNSSEFDNELQQMPHLLVQAQELEKRAGSITEIQRNIDSLNVEIGNEEGAKKVKVAHLERTRAEMVKLDGISNQSSCPLCGQKLNPEHLASVLDEYGAQISSLESEISKSGAKLVGLREAIHKANVSVSEAEKIRSELEKKRRAINKLEDLESTARKTREEISELKLKTQEITLDLESRDFVHAEDVELSALKLKREALATPLKEYSQLRAYIRQCEESGLARTYEDAALISSRDDNEKLVESQKEKLSNLEKLIMQRNQDLNKKKDRLEQIESSIMEYDKLKRDLAAMEEKRSESKSKFDVLTEKVSNLKETIAPLKIEVEELRRKSAKAALYRGYSTWLETLFIPAIENIESHVLDSIRDEFQRVFHRWFSELIEDPNVSASVDEKFTPSITQSGYDLDTQSLSGGERTAVALSYRLALNFMVKRANESMQTNLLILDEPTEGFSKEQTYRLRGVLEELECDQVILVSHERDLESLADKIYLVEKTDGNTAVKLVS